MLQDFDQHLGGRLHGVHALNQFFGITADHRFRLVAIDLKSSPNDILIGIIRPVIPDRSTLDPVDHARLVKTDQVNDRQHVDGVFEHLDLIGISGDPVEHQEFVWRFVA